MTERVEPPIRAAVLTVSDRASAGIYEDRSGPAVSAMLVEQLGAVVVAADVVPDDWGRIAQRLQQWARESPKPDLIATTGGTGFGPRDCTPEATLEVLDRHPASLMELARMRTLSKTPLSYASRGVSGIVARTLIINLPGSVRGATEQLEALLDVLPHCIRTLRGPDPTPAAPIGHR